MPTRLPIDISNEETRSQTKRWKVYYEPGKEPSTTHWDLDYLTSDQLDAAYTATNRNEWFDLSEKIDSEQSNGRQGVLLEIQSILSRLFSRVAKVLFRDQ